MFPCHNRRPLTTLPSFFSPRPHCQELRLDSLISRAAGNFLAARIVIVGNRRPIAMNKPTFALAFAAILTLAGTARAAVDLVTIPTREGTQLTIYNSEDITMVREHRLLTVKQGDQPHPVLLGQHADRPDQHRVPHPRPAGQGRSGRYDVPQPAATTPCSGTSRARWPARSRSRSATSPAASPGRPTTWASPTRTRRS